MQKEQISLQTKFRKLLAEAAKTKDFETLHGLLPVFQSYILKIIEEQNHSKWHWEGLGDELQKEFNKKRYIVDKPVKKLPTPMSEELEKELDQLVETTKKMVEEVAKECKVTLIKKPKKKNEK